jgi:hypothetical protein
MRHSDRGFSNSWIPVLLLQILFPWAGSAPALAQKCSDRNPEHALNVLNQLYQHCRAPDSEHLATAEEQDVPSRLILASAPVAGERSIPILRQLATLPKTTRCYPMRDSVLEALAKLGDEKAYGEIKETWKPLRKERFHGYPANIFSVGDDWALFALVDFLIEHVNDPQMKTPQGPSDGPYDYRAPLLEEIRDLGRLRRIPDFPAADYSPEGIAQWKAWLAKHKGHPLSTPVSQGVSDPYLQCLARKVEWGSPDAVLDIATFGGESAVSVLKQFPTPAPGQPMGARKLFPEIVRGEGGTPDPFREMQGNLQVSLAVLGDQEMLAQIASELEDFPYYWEYVPLEAVRKLRFIGGKPSVDILVASLGSLKGLRQEAEKAIAQCAQPSVYRGLHPTPEQRENARKECQSLGYSQHIGEVNTLILATLAEMVKDPPLPSDAQPTAENFWKWKDWWAINKDHAVFVPRWSAQSFE